MFVARENIFFLKEWLDYHARLGVSDFFLYDNSRSAGRNGSTPKKNKYGFKFAALTKRYTDDSVAEEIQRIVAGVDARCELICWSPMDETGRVLYGQIESVIDCVERAQACDWIGFFDIDEFVFSPSGEQLKALLSDASDYDGVTLLQKKFEDRFLNIGRPVTEITRCIDGLDTSRWAPKMFLKKGALNKNTAENIHRLPVHGETFTFDPARLRFNHYNVNRKMLAWARDFYNDSSLKLNADDDSLCRSGIGGID
ncbi:MAG: glycosyltransferase family 92 protein [Pseudomonadota bacterium]